MTSTTESIDDALRARLIDAAVAPLPAATLALLGAARVRRALADEIAMAIDRTTDLEPAEAFRQWCPIDGASTADYLYRFVSDGDDVALTSPRFKGGDRRQPFVHLHGLTYPGRPTSSMMRAIAGAYPVFAPTRIRWFDTTPLDDIPDDLEPDLRMVAAPLVTVVEHRPDGIDRIALVPATELDWYDRYVAIYDDYLRERPALAGNLSHESRRTLRSLIDIDGLFEVRVDGGWAGIVGTWRERDHLIDGHVVVERVLDRAARGQGLGAATVWHLASTLLARLHLDDRDMALFGTIAPANTPSIRSAMRVGRRDVGGYVFARLPAADDDRGGKR